MWDCMSYTNIYKENSGTWWYTDLWWRSSYPEEAQHIYYMVLKSKGYLWETLWPRGQGQHWYTSGTLHRTCSGRALPYILGNHVLHLCTERFQFKEQPQLRRSKIMGQVTGVHNLTLQRSCLTSFFVSCHGPDREATFSILLPWKVPATYFLIGLLSFLSLLSPP